MCSFKKPSEGFAKGCRNHPGQAPTSEDASLLPLAHRMFSVQSSMARVGREATLVGTSGSFESARLAIRESPVAWLEAFVELPRLSFSDL